MHVLYKYDHERVSGNKRQFGGGNDGTTQELLVSPVDLRYIFLWLIAFVRRHRWIFFLLSSLSSSLSPSACVACSGKNKQTNKHTHSFLHTHQLELIVSFFFFFFFVVDSADLFDPVYLIMLIEIIIVSAISNWPVCVYRPDSIGLSNTQPDIGSQSNNNNDKCWVSK